jgi:hypothetical protein
VSNAPPAIPANIAKDYAEVKLAMSPANSGPRDWAHYFLVVLTLARQMALTARAVTGTPQIWGAVLFHWGECSGVAAAEKAKPAHFIDLNRHGCQHFSKTNRAV